MLQVFTLKHIFSLFFIILKAKIKQLEHILKEVKANNPLTITPIEGGNEIQIHAGRIPLTPLILTGAFGIFCFFIDIKGFFYLSLFAFSLFAWHIWRHTKPQTVSIANNKLLVNNKSYNIDNISRIEFGNAITKTTSASYNPGSTTFIAGSANLSTAAGVGMANAMSAISHVGAASNAKKAFYVAIFYGDKKIKIAKHMREPAGRAFYEEIGRRLSMS